jgi:hypothetical protein
MKQLLVDFGQDVEAVLLSDRWHRVGVWKNPEGEADPDGQSSLEVDGDLVSFIEQDIERRMVCPVESVLAIRWKPGH